MNPKLFFNSNQIIRENDFLHTYAGNQELKNSIAYANDTNTIKVINRIPSISAVITTENLSGKVEESKGLIIS